MAEDEVTRNLNSMDDLDFTAWNGADWHGLFARYHTDDVLVDVHGQPSTHGIADAVVWIETIMFAGHAPGRALRMPPDPRRRRTARPDVLGGDEPRGRAAAAVGTAPLT